VPDAGVAAKWFLDDEDDLAPARDLLREEAQGRLSFVAPDCLYYEFGNLIRTAERRTPPRLTPARADEIIESIRSKSVSTVPSRLLLVRALERSRASDVSLYDAFYVVAAEMLGATFVTADDRLYERLRVLAFVRRLGQG
jgi:predicted nucleic acid-binding protein